MVSTTFLQSKTRSFLNAKKILEANGQYVVNNEAKARSLKKMNLRVAQSDLVSVIPINANSTNYQLNVLNNEPNLGNAGMLAIEQRLTQQDVFFTSALGFFLMAYPTAYPAARFNMWTYPSPGLLGVFGLLDLQALMGVWMAGSLEVKVNGEIVTPNWWLWNHMNINQTEMNVSSSPINPFWDQQTASEDGYQIVEPNWIINGGNLNQYTVKYTTDWSNGVLNGSNASNTWNFCICMVWKGWLAQNASSIMNNAPQQP